MYVSPSQAAGTLAMWAIRQSPYPAPDNLAVVVARFAELFPRDEFGLHEVSDEEELYRIVTVISEQIPELLAWNERKNGRGGMGFVSRYDRPSPDDDFIDLSALWSNVARSIAVEEGAASRIEAQRGETGTGSISEADESLTAASGDAQTPKSVTKGV